LPPEDDAFLRELIKRHPDAATKIGAGIDRFEIRKDVFYKQNVFLVRPHRRKRNGLFIPPLCERG
jgi:Protein of unknown function (DUF3223)